LSAREKGNLKFSQGGGEKMKKSAVLSVLFLFTFGATLGMVLSLNEAAQAGPVCDFLCLWKLDKSDDTGPLCPQGCPQDYIYYIWKIDTCRGGPLNCPDMKIFMGCWNGVDPIGCMP
jgi:hypothetical protein